ncbi:hypothetical protein [Runella limosa]|uniref:hypothetical protein n=1 Tax=Runella limosa TaxID=370978 RepID=UPI00040E2774|nr:hypothetical protein [Runella limosa]
MKTSKYQTESQKRLWSVFAILLMLVGFVYVLYKVKDSFEIINANKITIEKQKNAADSLDKIIANKKKTLDDIAKINSSKQSNSKELIQDKLIADKSLENAAINLNEKNSKSKVYIQVNSKLLLDEAKSLKLIEIINSNDFQASGYDLEEGRADNSIRYFHEEDKPKAEMLRNLLNDKTPYRLVLKQVKGFENKVKVGQLEIWIK